MQHLTQQQMTAVLDAAREEDSTLRLYCMILLGWRHGLRASEVCSLRAADIDLAGGYLTVQRLKGSLRTTQQLFPDEKIALTALLQGKAPGDYLFPGRFAGRHVSRRTFYGQFQAVCQAVGLPVHLRHPHVLKHTAGMTVIKAGIEYCRQYLGHKSVASTGAYLRVSDEAASRAAIAAFAL